MFGFGRKREKAKLNPNGVEVLRLLDAAALEIHPDRFPDQLDAGLYLQPILVTLNRTLGVDEERRFFPVNYEEVVNACGRFEKAGLLKQVLATTSGDTVIGSLMAAGLFEYILRRDGISDDNKNLGKQVRTTAQTVIDFLNRVETNKSKPHEL